MFEALLVLLALAVPVAGIAGFFMAWGARGRITLLEQRVTGLEGALASAGVPIPVAAPELPPQAAPEATPVSEPAPVTEPIVTPEPEPIAAAAPPAAPVAPAEPAEPQASFEERFGTRWVVWVGGLALALGGIFLVRYSIEQGLIGPGLRVFFGALFAAALVAAGERTRRQENAAGLGGIPSAHIPGILTAAGTTVAYATVYAAYGLYGFLPPALAFLLLGVVALATLGAALLHGPALAGLGLVGAYVAPMLVSTAEPNWWALHIYLIVVNGAAFALARARLWRWLAVTAIAAGTLWLLPELRLMTPHAVDAAVTFALAAALIVSGLGYGPPAAPGRIDGVSSLAVAPAVVVMGLMVMIRHHDTSSLVVLAGFVVAALAVAWRSDAAAAAVPAAGAVVALVMADWATDLSLETLVLPGGPTSGAVPEPAKAAVGGPMMVGALFAALFGAGGFLAQGRCERPLVPILWAATGVVVPVAILIALYYRIAGFERSIPFAALALLLAALYAVATEMLAKREPRPGTASAAALAAVGAIASLALALTFALEKGWLTVALALMVPGIAWVAEKRPLPMLRWLAAAGVVLVIARVGWDPRIVGSDVGTTPILNWILYGYGVPAAAFWVAGFLLRRRADDVPARMADSAAILFTVLTAVLEIRHYINHGDLFRDSAELTELALQVSVGLAMAIGLERVRGRTGSIVHDVGALVVAGLALIALVAGLWLVENPVVTGDPVGGPFVNLVLLGYGLPALLAGVLAITARDTRPMPYRWVMAVATIGTALMYLTLEVRTLFRGPVLSAHAGSNAELYTYSVVWLAFGVVLLVAGILLRSQPARLASAAVVLITVAKVFLIDLSDLEGVFRALSFIGLGLVLVGIGLLYQRLLFPRRPMPPAAPAPADTTQG